MDIRQKCVVCTPIEDMVRCLPNHPEVKKGGTVTFMSCTTHNHATYDQKARQVMKLAGMKKHLAASRPYFSTSTGARLANASIPTESGKVLTAGDATQSDHPNARSSTDGCIVCDTSKDWHRYARNQLRKKQPLVSLPTCGTHDDPTVQQRIREIAARGGTPLPPGWKAYGSRSAAAAAVTQRETATSYDIEPERLSSLKVRGSYFESLAFAQNPRGSGVDKSFGYNSAKIFGLVTADRHMTYAINAIEKAQKALAIVKSGGEPPTQAVKEKAKVIDALARNMRQLLGRKKKATKSDDSPEAEQCVHSKEIVWRHEVPLVAKGVAEESLPEQMEKIKEFLSR